MTTLGVIPLLTCTQRSVRTFVSSGAASYVLTYDSFFKKYLKYKASLF